MKGDRRLPFSTAVATTVPVDLVMGLDELAESLGLSRSAAMRQAMEEWMVAHDQDAES